MNPRIAMILQARDMREKQKRGCKRPLPVALSRGLRLLDPQLPAVCPVNDFFPDRGSKVDAPAPMFEYSNNIPPPPMMRREDGEFKLGELQDPTQCQEKIDLPREWEALIQKMAREMGKEAATYMFNPYLFPTPFSQDFDKLGDGQLLVVGTKVGIVSFRTPAGHVGVVEFVGTEIPPAAQTFVEVHPVINNSTMKSFERQTSYSGAATPGVTYPLGSLVQPRRVMHPLQEEMQTGIEMRALAAGPALPYLVRGVVRGRYWSPTIATQFWNYLKAS